jgi:serine/threonine-protein kinase HipA
MNPAPVADGLKLNITEADNTLDLELAREVAAYFRVGLDEGDEIIEEFQGIVRQWRTLAKQLGLAAREQDRMADAFRLAAL